MQEEQNYGRRSGVASGPVDSVKYAQMFGATGFMIRSPDEIAPILKQAMGVQGPVIIAVHGDDTDNPKFIENVHQNSIQ